ncbi:uncharacterized protein [Elaeis guineensis]|uniref:uncharacterized protein n=1 Tax=Elaeis guineensis var. tenera TaxID=51953 RepID=UPI003C6D70AE
MKLLEAKRLRLEDEHEDAITFTEHVLALHNDAVVVTANITEFNRHRIFIDNESSIDFLYFSVFTQMGFTPNKLGRFDTLIQDFSEGFGILEGMIRLPITVGAISKQAAIQVNFLVVKVLSVYNAILGYPSLWTLKVVVSSYLLMVKFSIPNGVG